MSNDKYMVIVVDDVKDFAKELNEAAVDNWELHSFQVTPYNLFWRPLDLYSSGARY